MIVKQKHYTVVLEYPTDVGGIYMAHVEAQEPHHAITKAIIQAMEACNRFHHEYQANEFFPAIVLAGWHDNIRPVLVVDEKDNPINDDSRLHKAGTEGKYPSDS